MQATGDTALADLPDELFGQDKSPVPALAPQWALDGKGAPFPGGGRGSLTKPKQAEDRPWRGEDDRSRDRWLGGGGALAGPRAPLGPSVGPRWREDDRPSGPPRRDPRWGAADVDPPAWMDSGLNRPPADTLASSPGERWGENFGRGRGRTGPNGPPTPAAAPPRWGAAERHHHPDRWGGAFAPDAGAQRERGGKWDKWGSEGTFKDQHAPHDEKWRPPHGAGFSLGGLDPRGDPLAAGRGRGFAIGRGRGLQGHSQAPGSDRWGSHHAHPPLTDPIFPDERQTPNKEASRSQDASASSHSKYTSDYMVARYQELQSANKLSLPAGVNKEDSSLFAVPGQPTVKEVLSGVHDKLPPNSAVVDAFSPPSHQPSRDLAADRAASSQQPQQAEAVSKLHGRQKDQDPAGSSTAVEKAGTQNHDSASKSQQPMSSPFATAPDAAKAGHEHLQDAWVYRDPNWQIQGPFPKADILDWFEGGFFPADLPIRHAGNPHADFKPLAAQIKVWAAAAPPGFAQPLAPTPAPAPSQPAPTAPDTSVSRQASGQPQPAHQGAQQPGSEIDRTFTLTSAQSYTQPAVGPKTASSARLDALETGLGGYGSAQMAGSQQSQPSQPSQQQPPSQPQHHQQQHQQQPAAQNATPDIIMQLLNATSKPSGAPAQSLPGLQGLGGDFLRQASGQQPAVPSLGSWNAPGHSQHGMDNGAGLFGNHSLHNAPQQHVLPTSLFPLGNSMGHQPSQAQTPSANSFAQLLGLQQQPLPQSLAQQPLPTASRGQHHNMLSEDQILQPHWSGQLSDSGLGRSPQDEFQRLLSQAASPHSRQQQQHHHHHHYQVDRQPSQQHDLSLGDLTLGKPHLSQTLADAQVPPPAAPTRVAPEPPQQKENKVAPPKRRQPAAKVSQPQQSAALEVAPGPAWGAPEKHAQSLANVQQEQQYQQQQQEQHDLDWDTPAPQPVVSKATEPKPAPWAGVKPPLPAGRSLADIQRDEEAKAAARAAAQPVTADVKTAAPGRAGHWGATGGPPLKAGGQPTLKQIQEEEERARQSLAQQQHSEHAAGGFSLRDSIPEDALGSKLSWAGPAARHPSEESAADLEGGNSAGYETFVQPPPPPPRKPVHEVKKTAKELQREKMEEQRRAAEAARQELKEERKPKQPPAGPAPSMALRTAASLQRALSNTDDDGMFWDYGGLASAQRLGNGNAGQAAQSRPAANGRTAASPAQQWQSPQPSPPRPPLLDSSASADAAKMSPEFKVWAMQQIRSLSKGQIEDPSILLDILMDLPSDGEVVEACLVNIGRSGAVSAFATEFIRRKATDSAGNKKGKGKAKAAAAAAPLAAAPATASTASTADASKFQKVPKAAKGKKGKATKGQKLDNALLGFQNKLDFAVLERGDDYA